MARDERNKLPRGISRVKKGTYRVDASTKILGGIRRALQEAETMQAIEFVENLRCARKSGKNISEKAHHPEDHICIEP